MWGSMPLMTVGTAVIIVLHFAEVVHIPHESWSSLIGRYPLYRWVPLHTSGVCAKTSLQECTMVSPSLQRTRRGFTGGVSPDHHGPPLAPCGSQKSRLPYPLIPSQTDPKRVHSIRTIDSYAKLGSTTYYTWMYPYKLMVVLFSWVVAPWTGPYIWVWWLPQTSGVHQRQPRTVGIHRTQFQTSYPKSLFFTLTGNNNDGQGDNR
jgi:hypothetical protein